MSIEHNSITDPNIHEPKGISTAGSGAVYIATGSGTGTWKIPEIAGQAVSPANSVPVSDGIGGVSWKVAPAFEPCYAEIDSPATIRTLSQNVEIGIDNFSFDDATASKFELNTTSHLVVKEKGIYVVHAHVTYIPQTALSNVNESLEWRIKINGSTIPQRVVPCVVTRNSDSSDSFVINFTRIIDLAANDTFTFTLKNLSPTRNYSIGSGFNLFKISSEV
jgi:hypothetical protein